MAGKKKLVQSGLWQMSNTIIIIVSQLAANAIMARYISKADFGLMALANAFINFSTLFSEAGMGDALLQRKHLEQQHKNAALFYSVSVSLLMYFILYFTAPFIASFYSKYDKDLLVHVIRVISLSFIFLSLGSSSLNMIQKNLKFKQFFFSDSLSLLVSNVLGVVLAIKGYGVWSIVYSVLFYNVARLIMVWIQEPIPIHLGATLRHWKDLFSYGVGLTLVRMNNFVSGNGIMLEIGKLVSNAMLGIFERSYRITNIPVRYLGDMIMKVMLPFMARMQDEDDKLFNFFYRCTSFSNSLLLPISFFAMIFCKPLVIILLGHKWLDAVLPMQILFFSLPFRITTKVSDGLMRAKNLVYRNAGRKFQYSIVLLVSIYIGWMLDKNSLVGISIAVTFSAMFNYVAMLLTIKRRVFSHHWRKLVLHPFKEGAMLSVILLVPAYGIYLGLVTTIKNEITAFTIVCSLLSLFMFYAVFKKPELLGKDFAELRDQIVDMIKNRGEGKKGRGGKRKRMMDQANNEENEEQNLNYGKNNLNDLE